MTSLCWRGSLQARSGAQDDTDCDFPPSCRARVAPKSLQILSTTSLILSLALSTILSSALLWRHEYRGVRVRIVQLIPQFFYTLSVCRVTYGRVSFFADYCEHCFVTSETLNVLGLRPLRSAISFPSFWWAVPMRAGQNWGCPVLLSANWQQWHFGAGLMRKCKLFCGK